jgi:hypothetical protein
MQLLEALIPTIIAIGLIVIAYQIFLSDYLTSKLKTRRDSRNNRDAMGKIAKVKLVSDDPKDIEKFITVNAQYLSDDTVNKLVERIELIKADRVIMEDGLKARIAATTIKQTSAQELDEIVSSSNKAMRRI